jgi:hypothetical protein
VKQPVCKFGTSKLVARSKKCETSQTQTRSKSFSHKKVCSLLSHEEQTYSIYKHTYYNHNKHIYPSIFYFTSIIFGMVDDELEQVANPNDSELLSWMELRF